MKHHKIIIDVEGGLDDTHAQAIRKEHSALLTDENTHIVFYIGKRVVSSIPIFWEGIIKDYCEQRVEESLKSTNNQERDKIGEKLTAKFSLEFENDGEREARESAARERRFLHRFSGIRNYYLMIIYGDIPISRMRPSPSLGRPSC